jgi:hypothetical protein
VSAIYCATAYVIAFTAVLTWATAAEGAARLPR